MNETTEQSLIEVLRRLSKFEQVQIVASSQAKEERIVIAISKKMLKKLL